MKNEGKNQDDCKSYTLYDLVMADGLVAWVFKKERSAGLSRRGDQYQGVRRSSTAHQNIQKFAIISSQMLHSAITLF
jgi:hypothetical protein